MYICSSWHTVSWAPFFLHLFLKIETKGLDKVLNSIHTRIRDFAVSTYPKGDISATRPNLLYQYITTVGMGSFHAAPIGVAYPHILFNFLLPIKKAPSLLRALHTIAL